MTYLDELKSFVVLHSRAQQLDEAMTHAVLASVTSTDHDGPDSWSHGWSQAGEALVQQKRWLEATKVYNLARFPFATHEGQHRAHEACVSSFQSWLAETQIKVESFTLADGAFKAYGAGLDRGWPVLIVTGGIVSIKEQWHVFLQMAEKLKLCVVVTEMPGVGENTLPYNPEARLIYPTILAALQGRADTDHCHLLALSFSGHLALRYAAEDTRITGITTVGAPIAKFFQDKTWFAQVPEVTKLTLAHLIGVTPAQLFTTIKSWALLPQNLPRIKVPVFYLHSEWDEIIPANELSALAQIADDIRPYRLPDVHGSPNHMDVMKLWIVSSILSTHPTQQAKAKVVWLLWRLKSAIRAGQRHA